MAIRLTPPFFKPKNLIGKNNEYSISYVLKKQSRSNDDFEVMLNNLTLEEVIALKLELAGRILKNKPYGLQIWKFLPYMIKDAVLKYALCASKSQLDAADFLGLPPKRLRKLIQDFKITDFFEEKENVKASTDDENH